jgi:putative hemolysin
MSGEAWVIVASLVGTALLIALNALYVFHEFAFVVFKPGQARRLAESTDRTDRLVSKGINNLDHYIAVDQLGITVTSIAVGWVGQPVVADLLARFFGATGFISGLATVISALLAFFLLTATQMIAGELMPKTVALRYPERVARLVALPVEITAKVLHPLVWLLNGLGSLTVRALGFSPEEAGHHRGMLAEELAAVVETSAQAGRIHIDPATIRRALSFSDLRADDILIPRQDIAALNSEWPLERVLERARAERFTRFPVYQESIDHIFGLLNVKDLVRLRDDGTVDMRQNWLVAVRSIPTLPESAPIEQVLVRLRQDRQQMALIVDEFGGTAGIVTVADITRWLVSDPRDLVRVGDDIFAFPGRTSLTAVETALGISLETELTDQESLGGLIMERLGRVPDVGDRLTIDGHELEVAAMKRHRITQVRLRVRPRQAEQHSHVTVGEN